MCRDPWPASQSHTYVPPCPLPCDISPRWFPHGALNSHPFVPSLLPLGYFGMSSAGPWHPCPPPPSSRMHFSMIVVLHGGCPISEHSALAMVFLRYMWHIVVV